MESQEHSILTLDTNVFKALQFRFDNIHLKKLSTLRNNGIKIVISDVIYYEMIEHLSVTIEEIKKRALTSLKETTYHIYNEHSHFKDHEDYLNSINDVKAFAKKRIDDYLSEISAEIIDANLYSDVDKVIFRYFNKKPPFEPVGKKQNEFKDAIALETLEGYAESNNKKIFAISKDSGWIEYCKESKWLKHMDLADALNEMQTISGKYKNLTQKFSEELFNKNSNFHIEIFNRLSNAITDIIIMVNNKNNIQHYEVENSNVILKELYLTDKKANILFIDNEECTFSVSSKVKLEAELLIEVYQENPMGNIHYFNFETDIKPIDTISKTISTTIDLDILVVLEGDWSKGFEHMKIQYVTYENDVIKINISDDKIVQL